jgi:hypothetical protein
MSIYSRHNQASFYQTKEVSTDLELKMAKELQRLKYENESRQREAEKICAESEEIRQLKEKIKAAYLNKERTAQIAENQIRKLDEIV